MDMPQVRKSTYDEISCNRFTLEKLTNPFPYYTYFYPLFKSLLQTWNGSNYR